MKLIKILTQLILAFKTVPIILSLLNESAKFLFIQLINRLSQKLVILLGFYDIIKNVVLDYPVYIDFEAPDRKTKQGNTDACISFCEQMEAFGYYVGIYASDISGFKERLDISRLTAYDKWVARYGSEPKYAKGNIWQYSSKGKVDGIRGNVDMDYSNIDFAKLIREKHLNGF